MQQLKTPAALAISFIIGAAMAGCGSNTNTGTSPGTSPAQPGYGAPATDPYNQAQYPNAGTPPATAAATPRPIPVVAPATGDATASPTPTPTASATPVPNDFKLRLISVQKKTSGFWLWKKAEISVQVQNPLLTRAQSGKVVVTYFFNGSIVGEPLSNGISLLPAEIKTYSFKATQKSDDSTAQVTTDGR
jgi:hypothetical protein